MSKKSIRFFNDREVRAVWDEIRVETGAMTVADGTRAPQLPANVSLLSRETYEDNTLCRYVARVPTDFSE